MQLYSSNDSYKIYSGDMLDMLEDIKLSSIDSIITDPPYELNFMGKSWDNAGVSFNKETWKKCYDVLKPGGYLLAFGGSRTYHRIACAIEDAGFEIRDTIMWIYGSGFPKSLNIGLAIDKKNGVESEVVGTMRAGSTSRAFQCEELTTAGEYEIKKASNDWNGWGSCLKPSFEPIIVARKPFKGTLVDNVLKYGVGGMNIDECRVGTETISTHNAPKGTFAGGDYDRGSDTSSYKDHEGRFPANTILTYDEDFEEVCGGFPNTKSTGGSGEKSKKNTFSNTYNGGWGHTVNCSHLGGLGDSGSAARYFYCAKASKKDRDEGLDEFDEKNTMCDRNPELASANMPQNRSGNLRKNTHPTVKPTNLMQYLIRLVTPNGGTILDPFNGSGSTGKAVLYENLERNKNYKYIGIELTEEYLPITKARLDYVCNKIEYKNSEDEEKVS